MLWITISIIGVFTFINLVFSIATAMTVSKIVGSEPIGPTIERPKDTGAQYQMMNGQWVEMPGSSYDQAVLRGQGEPFSDGLKQRPTAKNWDGIS